MAVEETADALEISSFLAEKGHVVSRGGGGGKTTLLYAFARHCAAKGWRVLVRHHHPHPAVGGELCRR